MTGADLITLLKKHPLSAGALLVCVICGALIYLRGGEITGRTQRSDEKTAEAAKVQANVANAAGLPGQTEALQASVKELESRLVRSNQIALNLQYFYRMESETGVKILDVRQNNVPSGRNAAKAAYVGVPYSISVQGTFAGTLLFLKKIETGRHITRFLGATYTKAGGSDVSDASALMTLSINLELLGQP